MLSIMSSIYDLESIDGCIGQIWPNSQINVDSCWICSLLLAMDTLFVLKLATDSGAVGSMQGRM